MAQVNLPATLAAAYWDKQKGALAKLAKVPANKLPDELKQFAKLHLAVEWKKFGVDKSADADAVKSAGAALEGAVKGDIKALLAQAKTLVDSASRFEAEAKKGKDFPKEVLTAVAAIKNDAESYAGSVNEAVDAAREALAERSEQLEAEMKKAAPAVPAKTLALAKSRLVAAVAQLAKPGGAPKPMRFVIVQGRKSTTLALAYAVGPAQEKLLKSLIPGEAPFKVFKDIKTEVVWENKALTFVSDKLTATVLKKVQAWLKKQFKLSPKMRVRNAKGKVEELAGGEDMTEALAKASAAAPDAGLTVAEVSSRLGDVQADIKKGLTGPDKAAVRTLLDSIMKLLKEGKADAADEALDEMEALLQGDDGSGNDALDEGDADGDEGDEGDEAQAEAEAAVHPAPVDDGRAAFTRRLTALQPQIKQAQAGDAAERASQLVEGVMKLAKAGRYADADKMLDAVEALARKSGGGAPGAQPGAQDAALAMEAWKASRATAVNTLKAVAAQVANAKHASSTKAILELQAVIKNLTPEPATAQQVKALQRWLEDDDVVNDVCDLAEDIRTPLLRALKQLHTAVAA